MNEPETILQFGTGMLLRSICANAVDAANRAGHYSGRIVVVQSTPHGVAATINRQRGEFTLIEQGIELGESIQRRRRIRSISRALDAGTQWQVVREVIVRPEIRVVVSNVTEAGFRLDADSPASSFPARLTDLLRARFQAVPAAPPLFVIPTELVPENGARLAEMVDAIARVEPDAEAFRAWIAHSVRFCSSLVDRITTVASSEEERAELTTIAEPQWLWAIEGDPPALREAFPIDAASSGSVIFSPDISWYRERKLRLLNGAHTAIAPMAMMAGCRTVREAIMHAAVGPFLRRMLLDEIAPSTSLSALDAASYAQSVLDRFANPWLDHEWRVILTNQTAKLRVRVIPSLTAFIDRFGTLPPGLIQALAASLRYARVTSRVTDQEAEGWWRGASYRIVDADLDLIDWHWRSVDATATAAVIPAAVLLRFAASVLADTTLWGRDLSIVPGLREAVARAIGAME